MQCIHAVSVHPLVRRGECVESASVSAAVGEPLHRGCAAGTSEPPTKALAPLESGDQCRVLIADLLGIEHMCGARTAFCRSCRGLSRLLQRGHDDFAVEAAEVYEVVRRWCIYTHPHPLTHTILPPRASVHGLPHFSYRRSAPHHGQLLSYLCPWSPPLLL